MANRNSLIDVNTAISEFERFVTEHPGTYLSASGIGDILSSFPTVDAVEVVRCKNCRWAKPYERNDGEMGYYCHFCGHAFKYGANWERLYTPIKEADDFCSKGERREGE